MFLISFFIQSSITLSTDTKINPTAAKFDKISGQLFLLGLAAAKLKNIPIRIVSAILTVLSLVCYLIGYSVWLLATLFYPNFPRKEFSWYSFASIKEQYQISSILGLVATILCIIYPSLLLPATWIFTASNLVWSIAEYHKLQNPPDYIDNFSKHRQSAYLTYTQLITFISALTAGGISLALIVPNCAASVLLASTIVGNGLTLVAFYYLKKSWDEPPPDQVQVSHSVLTMASRLSIELQVRRANASEDQRGQTPLSQLSAPHLRHSCNATPSRNQENVNSPFHSSCLPK